MARNKRVRNEYPRSLRFGDLDNTTDAGLNQTSFEQFGEFIVPAQQRVFVGNGKINKGVDNRGTYTCSLSDGTSTIDSKIRILITDANGVETRFIREDLESDASSGVNVGKGGKTGNEQELLFVDRDESILLEAQHNTGTGTVSISDSSLTLPVTIQTL